MKNDKSLCLVGLAGLAIIILVVGLVASKRDRQITQSTQALTPAQSVLHQPEPPALAAPRPSQRTQAEAVVSEAPRRENVVPETGGPPEKVVRVKPEQVLATVNGVAITLKDLVPLPKEKTGSEQMMSAEMYDFLFHRAVERELTVQAARAQGVELTEDQKKRLAEIRARSEERAPDVFDTVQQNPENTEFEQRDLAGLLLRSSLAERAGVPSPHVTPEQVEGYFQQHRSEYAQLPVEPADRPREAWQAADAEIRMKLASAIQAAHDEQMRKFVDDLKANANIVMVEPAQ